MNVIWYFVSPLWVFNICQIVVPGEIDSDDMPMVWMIQKYWGLYLIMIAQGIFYLLMTYYFEQRIYNLANEKVGGDINTNIEEVGDENVV